MLNDEQYLKIAHDYFADVDERHYLFAKDIIVAATIPVAPLPEIAKPLEKGWLGTVLKESSLRDKAYARVESMDVDELQEFLKLPEIASEPSCKCGHDKAMHLPDGMCMAKGCDCLKIDVPGSPEIASEPTVAPIYCGSCGHLKSEHIGIGCALSTPSPVPLGEPARPETYMDRDVERIKPGETAAAVRYIHALEAALATRKEVRHGK